MIRLLIVFFWSIVLGVYLRWVYFRAVDRQLQRARKAAYLGVSRGF